jgi:adenylosuccinate lyase
MLARTHGQSASPTTFGKEMKVFATRIEKQIKNIYKPEETKYKQIWPLPYH